MQTMFKAEFLRLFNELSSPNRAISAKANADILALQNNPNIDLWVLSKDLLESQSLTQIILGALLLYNKISKQQPSLESSLKQSIKQYISTCYLRITNKGVKQKLIQSLTVLCKEQIYSNWQYFTQQLIQTMKNGNQSICYGLLIFNNIPGLIKDKIKINQIQKEFINIIDSTIKLDDKEVFTETLNALVSWTKYGADILGKSQILNELLNRAFSQELQTTLTILDHSINQLYQLNKSYPIHQTDFEENIKIGVQQIVMKIISSKDLINNPQLSFSFSECSLSILYKVGWVYQSYYQQIFKLPIAVLQEQDYKLSLIGLNYFLDIQHLKLPVNIFSCVWKKSLQISSLKCKINYCNNTSNPSNIDFVDYRYHYRQLISCIFSKFYQFNLIQQCNNILIMIHQFLNSQDISIKQLGMFISLSISQSMKMMKLLNHKSDFLKQLFYFCFSYSSSNVQPGTNQCQLSINLQISCLKMLSLNTYQIVDMELQNITIQSCINKLKTSPYKCKQHAINLISLIINSMEKLNSNNKVILDLLISIYNQRQYIGDELLEIFITSFVQFIQKIPDCYPYVTQILKQQTQYFKNNRCLRCMQYILKSIQKTSMTQLESVFFEIKTLILSYIQTLADQTFQQLPLIGCIRYLHLHSYPPFQQIDNQIAQKTIQLVNTNPSKHWRLLKILRQTLTILNYKQNQMQTQPFSSWLNSHYSSINSLLVSFVPIINDQCYYQLFFQIQDELITYSYKMYQSSPEYLQVFSYASSLIQSSTNSFVLKSILHLYQSFLVFNPSNQFHLDLLKSALSGLRNSNSSVFLSYFKILQKVFKNKQPNMIGNLIRQQFLDVLLGKDLNQNFIQLLSTMLLKSISINKSSYFKSILIQIFNYHRTVISNQQFLKSIELFKTKFKM